METCFIVSGIGCPFKSRLGMNPSAAARNVEQILEKLFLKQIQENIEMINLLEKKVLCIAFVLFP